MSIRTTLPHFSRPRAVAALVAALLLTLTLSAHPLDPASAATRQTNVTFQTWNRENNSNATGAGTLVRGFRLTSPTGQTRCTTLIPDTQGAGNAVAVNTANGVTWRSVTLRVSVGAYKVTSYSSQDCRAGTSMAGSSGLANTSTSDRWTIYPGRTPKAVN